MEKTYVFHLYLSVSPFTYIKNQKNKCKQKEKKNGNPICEMQIRQNHFQLLLLLRSSTNKNNVTKNAC